MMPSEDDKPVEGSKETGGASVSKDAEGEGLTSVKSAAQASASGISSASTSNKGKPTDKPAVTTPSLRNSPKPSRETSPIRPALKLGAQGSKSRSHSQDVSPSRASILSSSTASSIPPARKLSTPSRPSLPPPASSSTSIPAPQPRKLVKDGDGEDGNGNRWPVSPRLKSPPPSSRNQPSKSNLQAPKRQESPAQTPIIAIQRSTPSASSTPTILSLNASDTESEDQSLPSGMRTPARGVSGTGTTLETVQESSVPSTPARDMQESSKMPEALTSENATKEGSGDTTVREMKLVGESGSESSGSKSDGKKQMKLAPMTKIANSSKPNTGAPSKSYNVVGPRGMPLTEGSTQNMTVETETVSSIPQVAVGGGTGERGSLIRGDTSTTLRLKPSSETIRPKKEKKKATRKTASLNSGVASTKADIFEAKVASAVDEANSSDSDETFVYESNPPEPHSARPGRFHSRTPSTTSTQGHGDHRGGPRSTGGLNENNHSVAGKRSMKFANNPYNSNFELDGSDRTDSGRGYSVGSARGNATGGLLNHRMAQIGRGTRGGHASIFDGESPFPAKIRPATGNTSRHSSRPTSPRNGVVARAGVNGKKGGLISTYDIDGEGADDERTPLVGSLRSNRTRNARRPGSLRQQEYNQSRRRSPLTRLACCFLFSIMALLVLAGAGGFVFATTKSLTNVHISSIENVLASEQEIMLDLVVKAINPNVMSVTITDMDVNIFAKSPHVGTDKYWREHPNLDFSRSAWDHRKRRNTTATYPTYIRTYDDNEEMRETGGVDEGTDPIGDPGKDTETMLLGRIFTLDSALTFDGSPIKHQSTKSVGELRLRKPGNETEAGGTERWERVIQHHFELIVRGVLKYQLPFSSRVKTIPIRGNVTVHPDDPAKEKHSTIADTTIPTSRLLRRLALSLDQSMT